MSRTFRWLGSLLTLAALFVVAPVASAAQATGGTVTGTIRNLDGAPVSGAQVLLAGTGIGGLSNAEGTYTLNAVPAGSYALQVTRIGYQQATVLDVVVAAGQATRIDVTMSDAAVDLGGIVVSASRQVERITDAPATITRIDERQLANAPGNSFVNALKEVKGLDFVQVGATNAAINARGFNSSFNNRMLMVEDGRISVLPESGLPIGGFTAIPKIDLAGIEILVGPGAALYGADASNGVVSLTSKDPFLYQGTTVEAAVGNRAYKDVQFRHAQAFGDVAFKVTGEWTEVNDFENRLEYSGLPETAIDFHSQVARVSGSVVSRIGGGRLEVAGGFSESDGVGQTNVGRNQFDGWQYNFLNVKFSNRNWYFSAYRNQSQSGNSYAVNRFTTNRAAMPGATDEEVRLASDWPSDGRLMAAELQNRFRLDALRTDVVLGGQVRRDQVSSDREWLTDRTTGEDVIIDQYGAYAQTRTELTPQLDLVMAARYDGHDNYDAQFSPKVGLVFEPAEGQALRLTFNRAFKSPTILQTNFAIPDFVPFVGVFGNTTGFEVKSPTGAVLSTIDAIEPESNTTWELGYKGVVGSRLYIDATVFRAEYENFFSPLVTIANPFQGQIPYFKGSTTPILGETGNAQILLTYFNLGSATLNGFDFGADFEISRRVSLSSTLSLLDLSTVDAPETTAAAEATALNSPVTKWTLGLDGQNFNGFRGGVTFRHVTGYQFASGINAGKIPTFNTVDLALGYDVPGSDVQINLGIDNLFTCRAANPADNDTESACGFNEKHIEMVNMPAIGTMFFFGVRVHR